MLTRKRVRELFHYNPWTGVLTWRHRPNGSKQWNARFAGKIAGGDNGDGYITVKFDGVRRLAHHVVWVYVYGYKPDEVDHEDHGRANNKLANLREVTRLDNARNHTLQSNNTSGHVGVTRIKSTGRWRAYVTVRRRQIALGVFASKEEAVAARAAANDNLQFHDNHGKKAA